MVGREIFAIVSTLLTRTRCSGSRTVRPRLANSGQFGLTLTDNEETVGLTLRENGPTLAAKDSQTARSAHAR